MPNAQRSENNAKSHSFKCNTSSKKPMFWVSYANALAALAEKDNERKGVHRSSDSAEYNLSGNRNQEITLRVPRCYFMTKNRRSSFDHSLISKQNTSATQYCLDSHLPNELCDDFSRPSFRSSFFCDKEIEYHKDISNGSKKRKKGISGSEIYQDFI